MVLELPSDAEPFIPEGGDLSDLSEPGCYCLTLARPQDVGTHWDRQFDTRPDYWDEFTAATTVAYVGAASDVLRRLEEHRDGNKRKAALLEVCSIEALRSIWWFDDIDTAFERESQLAMWLQNSRPSWYVHQR